MKNQNQKSQSKSKYRHLLTVEFPATDIAWINELAAERCDSMGSVVREAVREKMSRDGRRPLPAEVEGNEEVIPSKSTEKALDNSLVETPHEPKL